MLATDKTTKNYLHNDMNLGAVDTTAPITQPVNQSLTSVTALGTSTVPVRLACSAADGSGISRYELQQSTSGGPYASVALSPATATSITRSLAPGASYQSRVRATDGAGNPSEWAYGPQFTVAADQESSGAVAYTGA